MVFFKRKMPAAELAREAMGLGQERGLTVLNKVLKMTGRTDRADVELVESRAPEFGALWLHAICKLVANAKPNAAPIAGAAPPVIQQWFPTAVAAAGQAEALLSTRQPPRDPSGYRAIAGDLFLSVYPEFRSSEEDVQLAAGIELASAMSYFDDLLNRYKIA